ncbi:MAG: Na+/H+ antiporter subunit E [Xanthobacteraceae bacterium]
MNSPVDMTRVGLRNSLARDALARAASFFGFWLILFGSNPADLLVGALAAIVATWTSLHLLPPRQWSLRPVALSRLLFRFFPQSIAAGIDVARLALDPRMPLRPGFVVYQSRLPAGPTRSAFCTMVSLLPGTLPSGSDDDSGLVIHCLDIGQSVVEQLAMEEALFVRAFGRERGGG